MNEKLIEACLEAKNKAYCPYSNFHVGAALLTESNEIYTGCNVENCSYGGCICAERVAYCKAVSEGHLRFKAIAITSDAKSYTFPCGICRQFMIEFGGEIKVICVISKNDYKEFTLNQLLPEAFTPESLLNANQ